MRGGNFGAQCVRLSGSVAVALSCALSCGAKDSAPGDASPHANRPDASTPVGRDLGVDARPAGSEEASSAKPAPGDIADDAGPSTRSSAPLTPVGERGGASAEPAVAGGSSVAMGGEGGRPGEPTAGVGAAGSGGGGRAGDSTAGAQAGAGAVGSGGAAGSAGAGGARSGRPFCLHPPECVSVFTLAVGLETCCPSNGESCGYAVSYPESLDDGTCKPNSEMFPELPGQAEQRVSRQGAPDQLITPECGTRALLAFTLPGCCMPDNRCGVSTYQVADILLGLAGVPAPFTRVECVSADTLNAQFRATALAGMGQLPASSGTCDYAALDARLPATIPEDRSARAF